MTRERAEEFLLKLLLKDRVMLPTLRYYQDIRQWGISKTPLNTSPLRKLKLPVTDKQFEKLITDFGITYGPTHTLGEEVLTLLGYGNKAVGFYKSYRSSDKTRIDNRLDGL